MNHIVGYCSTLHHIVGYCSTRNHERSKAITCCVLLTALSHSHSHSCALQSFSTSWNCTISRQILLRLPRASVTCCCVWRWALIRRQRTYVRTAAAFLIFFYSFCSVFYSFIFSICSLYCDILHVLCSTDFFNRCKNVNVLCATTAESR